MRSIFVLLILVMIGLNGKGQSVTALPDSVLSQCCLEVTLLNGNVTTVDWVFVQYITRDGTGTKLFVEYAPNFGGIQWETQIRIQDDFDDVLERSKFIVIPFTVGSTDYGINRNWIANIEENTTTGGTWIYGRFGTPAKRKFSAVEDYETMKNLLLACRPRAIVVAENGLYTEGDTVRMGGFLIEPTTITTEGYNWQMKDTLSKTEFGLDYSSVFGDTVSYMARRWGKWRNIMHVGRRYFISYSQDTTGVTGIESSIEHSYFAGTDDPYVKISTQSGSGSTLILNRFQVDNYQGAWSYEDNNTNPYYSHGVLLTSTTAQLGSGESGTGDPGNGVAIGTYGFGIGADEYVFLRTKGVDNSTATVGQFLQLQNATSGKSEWATIDLSAYLPIADTAAMLLNYPSTAGYGIIDAGKTWRADTTSPNGLATRLFAKTLPTSILTGQVAYSNGSNLVGSPNVTYNGSVLALGSTNLFQSGKWANSGARPTIGEAQFGYNQLNKVFEYSDGSTIYSLGHWLPATGADIYFPSSVGIGTTTTTGKLNISSSGGNNSGLRILSTSSASYAALDMYNSSSDQMQLNVIGSGVSVFGLAARTGNISYSGSGGIGIMSYDAAGVIKFFTGGLTAANERARFTSGGNLLLGTTTDVTQSILTTSSTTKGSLPFPQMTNTQRNAITGVAHLNVANTTNNTTDVYDAVAGAWTSYGRLNATQTWTGVNTFNRSGTNGAVYWTTLNANISDNLMATSSLNTPESGSWNGIRSGNNGGLSFQSGATVAFGGSAGRLTFYGGLGSSNGTVMTLSGTLAGSVHGAGLAHYIINGNTYISNVAVTVGNLRQILMTPSIYIVSPNTIVATAITYDPVFTGNSPATHRFIESVRGDWYVGSTSGVMGIRTAPDAAYELKLNGDLFVQDSTRLTTTPAHSAITGLLTRDATGWVGLATIGTGLSYSGGVLSATASAPTQILAEEYNAITSTSSPQTFSSTKSDNFVNQGGTQASFTFFFPASPADGQVLTMTWNNAISTLTLDGNGNSIIGTAVTTAVAGTQRKFKFYTGVGWVKIY